ncbi:MAG: YkgJ family cysteine cluster protein [Kofleriaceae bacterium]|nr:YkgJ family cysteine cluster protein [Kofleriaceae bacterium]
MADRPPPPPVDADLAALIEKLAADLPNLPNNDEASRRFEWLLDALILRGQLPASFKRLAAKIQADRGTKIRLSLVTDKYEVESPDVDCASLIHLCGARCCSFEVALSPQDIAEKIVPFVVDKPYLLPRDPMTKKCACMDGQGACTIYQHRPATCRTYDCREDARVWIDYEARVPAPLPASIRPEPNAHVARDDD